MTALKSTPLINDVTKIHPYSLRLPLMTEQAFNRLLHDNAILKLPLETIGGLVIDRYRYQACIERGIEPKIEEITATDELDCVIRIHYPAGYHGADKGLLACVAVQFWEEISEEVAANRGDRIKQGLQLKVAGGESLEHRDSRAEAGALVGVSGRLVGKALELERNAPKLFSRVYRHELSFAEAYNEYKRQGAPKDDIADEFHRLQQRIKKLSKDCEKLYPETATAAKDLATNLMQEYAAQRGRTKVDEIGKVKEQSTNADTGKSPSEGSSSTNALRTHHEALAGSPSGKEDRTLSQTSELDSADPKSAYLHGEGQTVISEVATTTKNPKEDAAADVSNAPCRKDGQQDRLQDSPADGIKDDKQISQCHRPVAAIATNVNACSDKASESGQSPALHPNDTDSRSQHRKVPAEQDKKTQSILGDDDAVKTDSPRGSSGAPSMTSKPTPKKKTAANRATLQKSSRQLSLLLDS